MALSSASLQQQVLDLSQLLSVLPLDMTPSGYETSDLLVLMSAEGKKHAKQCQQLLAQAFSSVSRCQICAAAGSASSEAEDDEQPERNLLRFTVFPSIDFTSKSIQLSKACFACGRCRALRSPKTFVQLAAMRLGADQPEREELVNELCLHLAAVNNAPEAIVSNADGRVIWCQEVHSRAYAMQVLASNVGGWRLVDAEGQKVAVGKAGTAARLIEQLLKEQGSSKQGKKKRAAAEAQQQQQNGASKKLKAALSAAGQKAQAGAAAAAAQQGKKQQAGKKAGKHVTLVEPQAADEDEEYAEAGQAAGHTPHPAKKHKQAGSTPAVQPASAGRYSTKDVGHTPHPSEGARKHKQQAQAQPRQQQQADGAAAAGDGATPLPSGRKAARKQLGVSFATPSTVVKTRFAEACEDTAPAKEAPASTARGARSSVKRRGAASLPAATPGTAGMAAPGTGDSLLGSLWGKKKKSRV